MKRLALLALALALPHLVSAQETQLEISGADRHAIAAADGTLKLSVKVTGAAEGEFSGKGVLIDWDDKEVGSTDIPALKAGGEAKTIELELPRYGSFLFKANVNAPGKSAEGALRVVHLAPVPQLTHEETLRSSLGVNTHHNAPWSAFKAMGIHWARDYSWSWLGHGTKIPFGEGNGTDLTPALKGAESAGMILLPCIQHVFGTPTGYADASVVSPAYERFGKHFKTIPYWEIDNEHDTALRRTGSDTVPVWGPFIKAAHDGMKKSGSGAKIVLNGSAGIFYKFTKDLLASEYKDDFSVVNYHYYTGTVPLELARADMNNGVVPDEEMLAYLDQVKRISDLSHANGKESWLTEIGWDVTYGQEPVGARLQAVYLPRAYLTARLMGCDKIFWYFDRDTGANPPTRFDSCGIIEKNGAIRASGAAMAALSAQTATAEILGRPDLGDDDIWCAVLKKKDGNHLAAVWSVTKKHPLPESLASLEAIDIFGNSIKPTGIGPEVHYFQLAAVLPNEWGLQMETKLVTLSTLVGSPGGSIPVEIALPSASVAQWEELPSMFKSGAWKKADGTLQTELVVGPQAEPGSYPVAVLVHGKSSWKKRLPMVVNLRTPLEIHSSPFRAGEEGTVQLTPRPAATGEWTFSVTKGKGSVSPEKVTLENGKPATLRVKADSAQRDPMEITAKSVNGTTQVFTVAPATLALPRTQGMKLDGTWQTQKTGEISPAFFVSDAKDQQIQAKLSWSQDGVFVSAKVPSQKMESGKPETFWDSDCLELFLDVAPDKGGEWHPGTHQFFFVPVQKGNEWQLVSGRWRRDLTPAKASHDEEGIKTFVKFEQGYYVMQAFVPVEALGVKTLAAETPVRGALSIRHIEGAMKVRTEAAWPARKVEILQGSQNWGTLQFLKD